MSASETETPTAIAPEAYTDDYFLTAVEGHAEFRASGGRQLSPRLERALALAGPRPGDRLLDIGCGRGELALNAALRGARALGIDYAAAATGLAQTTLAGAAPSAPATGVARMDATHLALRAGSFDVALMLDFVEHVHQPELERALAETARALRPGGRLIIHTSPNRLFEEIVYPRYVRRVHRAALALGRALHLDRRFFNEIILPTDPLPPHDEYERRLHVNPQSASSLRAALRRAGFRVRRVDHWEPPSAPFFQQRSLNILLTLLDAVRFLRPLSRLPPLNRLFSNHIWVVAERR